MSAGTMIFESTPSPWTAENPTEATAAPIMPPISACDDDDGTPNHQVTRFHVIAPIRPAKIAVVVMTPASTMPLATVGATVIEMNAPAKLRIAATPTATFGFSAPVAMVVAIALAVSWKPFVKSNTSATATTRTIMMSALTLRTLWPLAGTEVASFTTPQHAFSSAAGTVRRHGRRRHHREPRAPAGASRRADPRRRRGDQDPGRARGAQRRAARAG